MHVSRVDTNEVQCTGKDFLCKTAKGLECLPYMYKCDNVNDCLDNEDEKNCDEGKFYVITNKNPFLCFLSTFS